MIRLLFVLAISSNLYAQSAKQLTLESIFKTRQFQQKLVYGLNSLKDGKSFASIVRNPETNVIEVIRNSYLDGKTTKVIYSEKDVNASKEPLELSTDFSDDETKVLISKGEEAIYRNSSQAYYFVYNILSKKLVPVSDKEKQLFPTFSPDGKKVAYVIKNNLFIKDLATGKEEQITNDGLENKIINGRADWVYEEEFTFAKAFFWSPDSKKIAFYRFDETQVPEFSMMMYNSLYPQLYTYKYPKAGEKNAVVSIHICDLERKKIITVDTGTETDQYIPRVKWTANSTILCVLRMNRHQNKLDYLLANALTGTSKIILTEQDKYYIDVEQEHLTFLANGTQFINVSERDGFNHLYLYNLEGKTIKQLTAGKWEVTSVYGIDEKNGLVYYQSAEQSPLKRDVYSINLSGENKQRLSKADGTNNATFSSDFSYYILEHSGINQPAFISLHHASGKQIRVLEDNSVLKQRLQEYKVPQAQFYNFKTQEGVDLNGYMIKPPDFNPVKKYPVLLYVYGGPGSQNVADAWLDSRVTWLRMLAQKGYIIACVDNRGTGFRGAEFKKMTYKHLGKYECIDQIEVARWFAKQSFVDTKRIGIWGWSFGGYLSSLCATKGNGIFSMAIAVAPVTNWRFYDTIYTERFLQTPQENPQGYDENSPIYFADKLQGNFLLVHGTADDNVHFQNSMAFSEALIQANKPFEQAYYPDKNHNIGGGNAFIHLFTKLTDYILKNL